MQERLSSDSGELAALNTAVEAALKMLSDAKSQLFEAASDATQSRNQLAQITSRLQEVMARAFNRVWAIAQKEAADLRTAALMEGVRRVAEGFRVRGLYP